MQPRPSFDRTLLIPIAIGVVSILGIGWIFLTSDLRQTFSPPTAAPTAIPFDDHSRETEIASFFPTRDERPPTAAETRPVTDLGSLAETLPSTGTLIRKAHPLLLLRPPQTEFKYSEPENMMIWIPGLYMIRTGLS